MIDITTSNYRPLGNWANGDFKFMARDGKEYTFSTMEAALQACKTTDSDIIARLAQPGLKGSDAVKLGSTIAPDDDFIAHKQDYAGAIVHAKAASIPQIAALLRDADEPFETSNQSVDPVWVNALNAEREILSSEPEPQSVINENIAGRSLSKWEAEFLFAKIIDAANNTNGANGDPLITTKLARQIRKEHGYGVDHIEAALKRNDAAALTEAANSILSYARAAQNHPNDSHLTAENLEEFERKFNGYLNGRIHFLPISPFDPVISDHEFAAYDGSKMLFADVENLNKSGISWTEQGIYDYEKAVSANKDSAVPVRLYNRVSVKFPRADSPDKYDERMEFVPIRTPLVTAMDKLGLTGLSEALTQKEYQTVAAAVSAAKPGNFAPASANEVKKAVHILNWLRENGYSYEMKTNRGAYGTQIVAAITGTNYEVTLTDPGSRRGALSYIGRVYNTVSAKSYYLSAGSKLSSLPEFEDMELVPLQYVLGKPLDGEKHLTAPMASASQQITNRSETSGSIALGTVNGIAVILHEEAPKDAVVDETVSVSIPQALQSARDYFAQSVDLSGLIAEYEQQKEAGQGFTEPQFSDDETVAGLQDVYWRYLTTDGLALKKPDHYFVTNIAEILNPSDDFSDYGMTREEAVKAHFESVLDSEFGVWTDDEVRISPKNILLYMGGAGTDKDRERALFKEIHDQGLTMQNLIGGVDEFENIKAINNGLEFDPKHAHLMKDEQSPLIQAAYHKIVDTLKNTAGVVEMPGTNIGDSIQIDRSGVVKYEVYVATTKNLQFDRASGKSFYSQNGEKIYTDFKTFDDVWAALKSGDPVQVEHAKHYIRPVTGYIGQIFDYDAKLAADGISAIRTKYPAGNNALLVPGYTAQIMPDKPGFETNPASRTLCFGYEDHLMNAISATIRRDLSAFRSGTETVGTAYSLDGMYGKLYDEKFPLNYMQESAYGRTQEDKRTILKTLSKKIKFDQRYQDGADVINANLADQQHSADPCNDVFASAARELNYTCVNRITQDFAGYTSLNATSTAKNIGLVRFLTEGASVDPETHRIHPSMKDGKIDVTDETPAMKNERFRNSEYDAADRVQKAFNDFMTALSIAKNTGFAMADIGGWTMDDGYVVSKSFADKYKVPDEDWNKKHPDEEPRYRSLEIGDKISDCHGNKGTISLVVDPAMDDRTAEKQGMLDAVKLFRANPNLDVVGAAYPGVSRQNGGTYLDGHEQPMDLVDPRDGSVKHNCACRTEFGILSQTADKKTHIYGRDEGRAISAELSWILSAEGLSDTMKEFYGQNLSASVGLRELLNVLGGDLSAYGGIGYGIQTQPGESRHMFYVPEIHTKEDALAYLGTDTNGVVNDASTALNAACSKFLAEISHRGGYLVIPKDLDIKAFLDDARGFDGVTPSGSCFQTDSEGRILLPVMGPALRSGTELYDGTVQEHDYTRFYRLIYRTLVQYEVDKYQKAAGTTITGKPITHMDAVDKRLREAPGKLQSNYDALADRIFEDQLKPGMKRSYWKSAVMSRTAPQSATMVMTANPALDIGELGMSFDSAKKLGYFAKTTKSYKDAINSGEIDADGRITGDGAMIWRDPTLRPGAVRYVNVRILPGHQRGVSINPFTDKSFDGDFDGDQLGVVHLRTKEANTEMREKVGYSNALLDESSPYPMDENGRPTAILKQPVKDETGHVVWKEVINPDGKPATYEHHELFFNHGLDIISGEAADPRLKERYKTLEDRINWVHQLKVRDSYMYSAARLISAVKKTASKAGFNLLKWNDDLSNVNPDALEEWVGKPENEAFYKDHKRDIRRTIDLLRRFDKNRYALAELGLKPDPEYVRKHDPKVFEDFENKLLASLSRYTHLCYKASAMNNVISFGDMPEHLQTVAKYVNEGCKGKPAKLIGYMKALGVTVSTANEAGKPCIVTDADKHMDVSTIAFADSGNGVLEWINPDHSTGLTAQDKQDQQQANATKSCLTGEAGAQSQHGMAALRNATPKEVLNLTYGVTQSVLQVKKSAEEAELKTQLLSDVVTALWQGKKIEKVDGAWRVAVREAPQFEYTDYKGRLRTGECVPRGAEDIRKLQPKLVVGEKATPKEWVGMFKAFYEDSAGMNLGPINGRFVRTVAKALSDSKLTTMIGVSSDDRYLMDKSSVLDRLAYEKTGGLNTKVGFVSLLRGHSVSEDPLNLFGGHVGHDYHAYMPQQIKDNIVAALKGKPENVVPIIAKECQEGYQAKFHRSFASTVKRKDDQAECQPRKSSGFKM